MVKAYVLVDAAPSREAEVLEAFAKEPAVIAGKLLKEKAGQMDILLLVEGADRQEIERLIAGPLRSVSWVQSIQRVMPQHTILGSVQRAMEELEHEVLARRS